ncbi:unnamed protein product, partial [Staurois parvus]
MWGDQRVNCVLFYCVCAFNCKHTALYGSAMQSHAKQCVGADGRELYCLHTCTPYPEMQN